MPDKKEDTKTTIVESAAKGGMSAVMPYVVVIGGGLLAYKYLKDDAKNLIVGGGGRVIERTSETVKEIVNNTIDTINNTTENISNFIDDNTLNAEERKDIELEAAASSVGSAQGVKLPNLSTEQQNFISKYSDDKKKTTNFRESPFLDLGLGPSTSPLERSMQGLGLISGDTTNSGGGVNVSDIKTHEQAVSMGLGNAPLAVNANPKIDKKAVSNKSTNRSLSEKVAKSGMPASNLKNARSVSTSKDSAGKERIVVKYKNGVTLRY